MRKLPFAFACVVALGSVTLVHCGGSRGSSGSDGGSLDGGGGDGSAGHDGSVTGDCGARSFQCTGACVCTGAWLVDGHFAKNVSASTACSLMKLAEPNGGNVPFGSPCESACAESTAKQCSVSNAYYTAFEAANPGAGPDASYACPDASATVALTCDVEHYAPMGGCHWTQCMP